MSVTKTKEAGQQWLVESAKRQLTPKLDPSIVAASDDESVVELQTSDRIVVRAESVDRVEGGEGEDDHSAIRSSRDEDVRDGVELKLADERGVTLQEGEKFADSGSKRSAVALTTESERYSPRRGGPDPNGRVQAAGDDSNPIESDSIDLVNVTSVHEEALSRVDVPELRGERVSDGRVTTEAGSDSLDK